MGRAETARSFDTVGCSSACKSFSSELPSAAAPSVAAAFAVVLSRATVGVARRARCIFRHNACRRIAVDRVAYPSKLELEQCPVRGWLSVS